MKFFVTAKPNARENRVEVLDPTHFVVRVKAKPDEGRANEAVLETLARHLGVPKSRLSLVSGFKSKQKVIQFGS